MNLSTALSKPVAWMELAESRVLELELSRIPQASYGLRDSILLTLENMSENWFMVVNLITIKGERESIFINEAGLYHLIFRSNKPKTKEFASWVCETVLPEIHKIGFFGTLSIKDQISISKQIESISLQIVNNNNAFRRKLLQDQLRRFCNIVNQPIPPTEWIALNHDQVDLFDSPQAQASPNSLLLTRAVLRKNFAVK